jgi:hypothetical protein
MSCGLAEASGAVAPLGTLTFAGELFHANRGKLWNRLNAGFKPDLLILISCLCSFTVGKTPQNRILFQEKWMGARFIAPRFPQVWSGGSRPTLVSRHLRGLAGEGNWAT